MPTIHGHDDAMSQLKSLRFDNIPFPYQNITVKGGVRKHVHEYPHMAGGAPEKLGRSLYNIDVKANFLNSLVDAKWDDLYPDTLIRLCKLFEAEETKELVVPNPGIGAIQAYCTNWSRELDVRMRSGEYVTLNFLEDQSDAIVSAITEHMKLAALAEENAALKDATEGFKASIFDQIQDSMNGLFAIIDTGDMYGNLVESKITALTQLINEADQTVRELNSPEHWRALEALHALWETLVNLTEDLNNKGAKLREWTVPREMTITDAAMAIYFDASRADDLLGLNVIADPLAIPAGTILHYYED